jgi:putative Mn2+ efflux pump MntP
MTNNIEILRVLAIFILGMAIGMANFVFGMYYGKDKKK